MKILSLCGRIERCLGGENEVVLYIKKNDNWGLYKEEIIFVGQNKHNLKKKKKIVGILF